VFSGETSSRTARALFTLGLLAVSIPGTTQIAVRNQGYIPYSGAPIYYRSDDISDAVTLLQRRLDAGDAQLNHRAGKHGYLRSVLELLDISAASQTLVFSKTSFQYPKISPEHPRALYFNDDVYVGVVNDGKEIEVISFDKQQGAIFFILHEQQVEKPRFERAELDCTQCHIASGTRGVPGVLLRSVRPSVTGAPVPGAKHFNTDQNSPLEERWGGWYATGSIAERTIANLVAPRGSSGATPALAPVAQRFDPAAYLASGSDEVALLVLAHQTQMHNLIALTNYKTRIALHAASQQPGAAAGRELTEEERQQFERPAEELLRYLLFAGEAALPQLDGKVIAQASQFAQEFQRRGPRDSQGRSLRDFDLNTRLFTYPCSYLIYSDAFDALPEPSKSYVYGRLLEVLSGRDESQDFQKLSAGDRRAILEVLLQTKSGLPPEWHDFARNNLVMNRRESK